MIIKAVKEAINLSVKREYAGLALFKICLRGTTMGLDVSSWNIDQLMIPLLSVLSGFLATLVGVILGFELERYRDSQARNQRLVGALQMMRDEIERNVSLCEQIWRELSQRSDFVEFYNLKTTTWESVSSALVDLKSPELVKQISTEYYEYEHLKRRIDARFDFFKDWDRSNVHLTSGFDLMTNSVQTGAHNLMISGKNTLDSIDKQLSQLS